MTGQPFFSIVIPTLNEEKYLPLLLQDLANQSFANFEVIVVDGQSDDQTHETIHQFKKKLALTEFVVNKRNVSYQRNHGGKKARGQWVIFMDADNRLPHAFLDGVKYQIAKYQDFDVFTTWMDSESDEALDISTARILNFGLEIYHKILKKPAAAGALIGVKRSAFRDCQFDEHQQILEDSLFVQQLTQHGYQFRVLKEPRFVFSLRRLKKEGTLKMVRTVALTQWKYLQGDTFEHENYGYTMQGGMYYDEPNSRFLHKINDFILNASKKQLDQAKKIFTSIKDFEW